MRLRVAICGLWLMLSGCRGAAPAADGTQLDSLLQAGDLVFRRGSGLASRAVLAVDDHSVYSHIGLVVRQNDGWHVVHAVPGEPDFRGDPDRVKMEPLSFFLRHDRALKGAIMRLDDPRAAASAASQAVRLFGAGVLFDHDYDLRDTTRLYCTEMVHTLLLRQGVDLTEGRRTHIDLPGFGGDYILPGDIQRSTRLTLIHQF